VEKVLVNGVFPLAAQTNVTRDFSFKKLELIIQAGAKGKGSNDHKKRREDKRKGKGQVKFNDCNNASRPAFFLLITLFVGRKFLYARAHLNIL